MNIKRFYFLYKWLDNIAKIKETDAKVDTIKDHANKQIDQSTVSIQRANALQTKVMQRTTTYYLGRAAGFIK